MMSIRTPAKSAISGSGREFGRRHGNAASAGTYDDARDIVRGAEQGSDALSPNEPPSGRAAPASDWFPRTRTAEELRARFQDGHQIGVGAARGYPMHHGGRRLTDFDLDEQEERLRMPEPMPISWLSPVRPQPPSAIVRHLSSAALGLTVGLAIAVPAVLWQKGRIDPVRSVANIAANFGLAAAAPTAAVVTEVREPAAEVPRVMPRTVTVPVEVVRPAGQEPATASAAVTVLKPAPVPPSVVEVTPVLSAAAKAEALIEDARRLMSEGDFRTARSVLENQTVAALPAARFLLAETYDPNYLAARGVRSVRAEVPRAIELYRLALDGGIEAARQRISALRP
jgi:hypothetical protein